MATAVDVMRYIKSQMNVNGEVQLQKLVYYAQAWSLAWDGRPLFHDRIEAWRMGPVAPNLRYRIDEGDSKALRAEDRATVDAVIRHYGSHHGQALATMTHSERPWAEAWEKRPDGANRCDEVISHDAIRQFYTEKALSGADVPERAPVRPGRVDDDTIREIAAANSQRWKKTLAILAE
ncbi:DUF4065 domain-containing protein [Nocardioides panacisoli]|uniref:Panacea domain-containing protein n=1 Tax=Nocardioides panacisoli TaxID=627624 RepID=UPI001C62A0DD|nr:type II toxin-antitoxin system antitoxin SocA domain-containing protein [Nocardioides panacisoli]QYJ05378.1 DUF4065 domain-containing protein [Nocardioides panacisoli]